MKAEHKTCTHLHPPTYSFRCTCFANISFLRLENIQVFACSIALSSSYSKYTHRRRKLFQILSYYLPRIHLWLSPNSLTSFTYIFFHHHASTNALFQKPTATQLSFTSRRYSVRSSIDDHDFIHLEILEIFHPSPFLRSRTPLFRNSERYSSPRLCNSFSE